jgi:hypothetical protein
MDTVNSTTAAFYPSPETSSMITRIALTIRVNYLPEWAVYEGLRELVQNWLDAKEMNLGTSLIEYNAEEKALVLHNQGTIDRSALLLGPPSDAKLESENARGKFGEGLKLGSLALVREGLTVEVLTPTERWVASIAPNEDFGGAEVLTWTIYPHQDIGITVRVVGLEADAWENARSKFLVFEEDIGPVVDSYYGQLLLDERWKGKVYVKGIFVQDSGDRLAWGYNFTRAQLDRDRKMVSDWDLETHASDMAAEAQRDGSVTAAQMFDACLQGKRDTSYISSYSGSSGLQDLSAVFTARYGEGAIPVETEAQELAAKAVGLKAIRVPSGLYRALRSYMGAAEENINKAATTVKSRKAPGVNQKRRLDWGVRQLVLVTDDGSLYAEAVQFFGETKVRIDPDNTKNILVDRSVLSSRGKTIAALVDGYLLINHKANVSDLYAALTDLWFKGAKPDTELPALDEG